VVITTGMAQNCTNCLQTILGDGNHVVQQPVSAASSITSIFVGWRGLVAVGCVGLGMLMF
jgi:hypothetical protein